MDADKRERKLHGYVLQIIAFKLENEPNDKNTFKTSVEEHIYTENIGINKFAATPYQRINRFSNKSLQNHIEGSETDHIERGLQNQYQRWFIIPRCYTVDPFIKIIKFPRRFLSISQNRDFDYLIN